jgi:formylglycine-generating enzyme required for sulfatase activity
LRREGAGPRAFASATERFRAALLIDPANARAIKGLGDVQRRLIERALDQAFAMKFESANRALEQADSVQAESSAVRDARAQVRAFRAQTEAEQLTIYKDALASGDADAAQRAVAILAEIIGAEEAKELEAKIVNVRLYGGFAPGERFADKLRDGNDGPRLVVVPIGQFTMGSPDTERGRDDNEGPQRELTIDRGFAMSRNEITVAEFRAFVESQQYLTDAERAGASAAYDEKSGRMTKMRRVTWRRSYTGKRARDGDPVVHVSHSDALAYAAWLSSLSGKRYRLPSEAEFEYALRAGSRTSYPWGDNDPTAIVGNFAGSGEESSQGRRWTQGFAAYDDGHWGPAPVRSFPANPFRLYDLDGNVSEWVDDCWHDDYRRAPDSPKAWVNPGCDLRVIRGGSWGSAPAQVRSAWRGSMLGTASSGRVGFRVVREL